MANLNNRQALVESLKQAAERARHAREQAQAAAATLREGGTPASTPATPGPSSSTGSERQP